MICKNLHRWRSVDAFKHADSCEKKQQRTERESRRKCDIHANSHLFPENKSEKSIKWKT